MGDVIKTIGLLALWVGVSAVIIAVAWTGVSVDDDNLASVEPVGNITTVDADSASVTTTSDPGPDGSTSVAGISITSQPEPAAPPATSPTSEPPTIQPISELSTPNTSTPGVAPPEPPPTTAASVPVSTSTAPAAPTTAPTPTPTSSSTPPPQPATSSAPVPASTPTTAPPSIPTITPPPLPSTPPTTLPTTPPPAAATPPSIPTTTTTADPTQELIFELVGGFVKVEFSPTGAKLISAIPNPGFEERIEGESPGIVVEFRSDEHRSRIDAWWSDGPQHDIREDPLQ